MANQQANCGAIQNLSPEWMYDGALAATCCGVVIADASQRGYPIIYCNPAFETITGYSQNEVIGRSCRFLQGADTDKNALEKLRQALGEKRECQVVIKNYRKNGAVFWNELTISPLRDTTGTVTHFIGVQKDITEQKEAQEALRESETRLRLALNAANMGVWDWDVQTGKLNWSEEVESLFGLAAGSFEGTYEAYLQRIPSSDCYRVTQEIVSVMQAKNDYRLEHPILRPDGTIRWVQSRGAVLRDETGKAIRMTGTVMDITDRKAAEEELRQQAEREQLTGAIAQRIRQSLNLDEVLNTAVAEVREFLKTDRVVLYRFYPDGNGVVIVESAGDGVTPILGSNIKDPCFGEKYVLPYQQGRIRAIEDIYNAGIKQCHIDLLERFGVKANLVVPVLQGQDLWGLLIAHDCSNPRKWEQSEVKLLQQLSVQLAIAIQQSSLVEQLRTELKERLIAERHLRESENCLRQKATELEQALSELRQTQAQLIQIEKMSSLGQLVAGVAHEINNPVSFIYGNLEYANQYVQDLLQLLQVYRVAYPQPAPSVVDEAEKIDLDFLIQDFPKLLTSMKMGADRIRDLVLSLRNFSRHDQAEKKPVDIHQGIDNTLLILQHRLKAEGENPAIQIVKEYGDLPPVECYPGQLNQVFMNILSNAIDALDEPKNQGGAQKYAIHNQKSKIPNRQIRICTELQDQNRVIIRIADNGSGIPETVKERIFDPFFTTKPVGEGTGLGLSISYQVVVDRHGGQLKCLSTPGQGTEFIVEIPLKQTAAVAPIAAYCRLPLQDKAPCVA
ncbi:PAS domain S-box protein [Microcoleus sp. FACHB-831]|uniref:PAS domain-containing sensor histidine kinase n=1 Tax=Microcoleus sp. FACHB-831 TaxID=2692827 RepID=UPI0016825367|nr:PAS domain S-box protein [Microcoleus sp. FACHB-831]MBD1924002.1 PAS domain S-box protein [Microcoleus sp. FACHB-831]